MKYDVIIIGAGMSGLTAGIRLAMFDKKVLIIEKHSRIGGLNSYYKKSRHDFDVGLHAMTNFINPTERGRPLNKILKQLRLKYSDLKLTPQKHSKIVFKDQTLTFTNEIEGFVESINQTFPDQTNNFLKMVEEIKLISELPTNQKAFKSSRTFISQFISEKMLVDMILCPLLFYGSALEDDMDFDQFVIMFKSIFLEGFCRPIGGIKPFLQMLLEKFLNLNGDIRFKQEAQRIITKHDKVKGVQLSSGETIECDKVISSIGLVESLNILDTTECKKTQEKNIGKLSFTENIFVLKNKPLDLGGNNSIIFYNDSKAFSYRTPKNLVDDSSAVIAFPNNFVHDDYINGIIRVTNLANFNKWKELSRPRYLEEKEVARNKAINLISKVLPNLNLDIEVTDSFTPLTVERYTGHLNGCVYGAPTKQWDGLLPAKNLFLCGTDQGFLGIVGSMLSGISMANRHCMEH